MDIQAEPMSETIYRLWDRAKDWQAAHEPDSRDYTDNPYMADITAAMGMLVGSASEGRREVTS